MIRFSLADGPSSVWAMHAVRATLALIVHCVRYGKSDANQRMSARTHEPFHTSVPSYSDPRPHARSRNLKEGYFESVTLDCSPCLGTPATTMGVSIAVIVVLVLLLLLLHRFVWRKMNKRGRRRTRATLKIVFVFAQVLVALPPILDMPLPPVFQDILLYMKIPAFNFVIDK